MATPLPSCNGNTAWDGSTFSKAVAFAAGLVTRNEPGDADLLYIICQYVNNDIIVPGAPVH